ncbi:UNVERIFIED_CONTAM: ABC-type multidrug transport system fused ATPase/permease subunit [Brevibacillus sp. OAP136]
MRYMCAAVPFFIFAQIASGTPEKRGSTLLSPTYTYADTYRCPKGVWKEAMIEVVKASKRFGTLEAVSQLSFTVKPGEVVGLLGENGAGKTTTMRLISGILQPSDGEIRIGGILTSTEPLTARKQVGLLFGGDVGLYGRLTAWENIAYFGRLYGMGGATAAGANRAGERKAGDGKLCAEAGSRLFTWNEAKGGYRPGFGP